jgi:hypothetical protein
MGLDTDASERNGHWGTTARSAVVAVVLIAVAAQPLAAQDPITDKPLLMPARAVETTPAAGTDAITDTPLPAPATAVATKPLVNSDNDHNIEIHGFLLGNFTGRTTGLRPSGPEQSDFLLAEERLRLEVSGAAESIEAAAQVRADFFHDAIDRTFDIDLREAYVDYTTGKFDFRLGRQIVTWGVGDLLFINDVFPKDYVSFFSGRPLEYLKLGVDGFRTRYSSDRLNAELITIPFFTPDNLPTPDRFLLFDPFPSVTLRDQQLPDSTYGNTELGLRLYRKICDFDVSAYVYRGFWQTPSMRPDSFLTPTRVTAFHPPLSVYGVSAQGSACKGVVSIEAGYYDSRHDEDGDDRIIPNSEARFLVGYQRELAEDTTVGLQYYFEIMEDHAAYTNSLPAGFPAQKEYRDIITIRLERLLEHQTWKLAWMCFYSPADNDFLLQPQVSYKFSDNLAATVGANIFGGERSFTRFGQFDNNDNVYLSVRFDF